VITYDRALPSQSTIGRTFGGLRYSLAHRATIDPRKLAPGAFNDSLVKLFHILEEPVTAFQAHELDNTITLR
jgi:hypothetical protein